MRERARVCVRARVGLRSIIICTYSLQTTITCRPTHEHLHRPHAGARVRKNELNYKLTLPISVSHIALL